MHIAHSSAQQTSTVCKVCTLRFAHLGTSAPNAMASRAIILNGSNLPSVADSAVQCNQHPTPRAGRTSCNAFCLAQLRGIPNIFQIISPLVRRASSFCSSVVKNVSMEGICPQTSRCRLNKHHALRVAIWQPLDPRVQIENACGLVPSPSWP